MAHHKHPKHLAVLSMLLDEIPPKVIAGTLDVGLGFVYNIQNKYTKTVKTLKKNIPNPDQLWFPFIQQGKRD
jgi:hypothetical protein